MKPTLLFLTFIAFACAIHAQPCYPDSSIKIVVLGSSTAAGTGASTIDSAWVNRYRAYLQSVNPNNEVVNLGIGATTTYQIMPDGFVPPVGRPNPNPNNNITKAIELQADAIIVNMPSNDAFFGIDAETQMENFKTIAAEADSAEIPIWICTTQPRNLFPGQIQTQLSVRDSIFSYFANYAIDFWTTIAGTDNLPHPLYDSGDGIHLNDSGHRILFERVVGENIPAQIMDTCRAVGISDTRKTEVKISPNPSDGNFTINLSNPPTDALEITLFDLSGKTIFQLHNLTATIPVSLPQFVEQGMYLLHLKKNNTLFFQKMVVICK